MRASDIVDPPPRFVTAPDSSGPRHHYVRLLADPHWRTDTTGCRRPVFLRLDALRTRSGYLIAPIRRPTSLPRTDPANALSLRAASRRIIGGFAVHAGAPMCPGVPSCGPNRASAARVLTFARS